VSEASTPKNPPPKRRTFPVLTVNRMFVLLLAINGLIWLGTFAVMAVIAATAPVDPQQMPKIRSDLYSTCEKVFMLSSGAFIGLLGGRAGAPDKVTV
jgi:hypothetical protein